jgi:hypothetical protein
MALAEIIFDCVERFKKYCLQSRNWKVYEGADLIRAKNRFHRFVWARQLRPLTFENMVRNPLCAVTEGVLYRIERVSFMAFVVLQPSSGVLKFFEEEPSIQRWVALYDLSRFFRSKPICVKLNETKSPVFSEFERFLSEHYNMEFELIASSLKAKKWVQE